MRWPVATLAEVVAVNPRGETLAADAEVSFVGMAELDAEAAAARPRETKSFSDVSKGYTVFRDGDVLAAKITPCWENGKVGQAHLDHAVGVGSTEFHVLRPTEWVHDRYLLHFLRQPSVRHAGERRMTGSAGQRRVPVAFLANLQLPLPPVDEQRRIADILDCADALRAKRRQAVALFDELAHALFLGTFGDPASNERRWDDAIRLDAVADVSSGITKGRKLPAGTPTRDVPYMAVANVQDRRLDLTAVKTIAISEDELQRYRLQANDLLLTEGGDPDKLGRGTLWRDELPISVHQNHIFKVRLRDSRIRPVFLSWLIGSERGKRYFLRSAKQTTGIASINMTQLRAFPLLAPPVDLQLEFERKLAAANDVLGRASCHADHIDGLFSALQERAFAGVF